MSNDTITIIIGFMSSSILGVIATSLFNRRKTNADTKNASINGEIDIGKAWMTYGKEMQVDLAKLKVEFAKLSIEFQALKNERDALVIERAKKDKHISELEERVSELELKVKQYESMGKDITEQAHTAIDKIAENITIK